MTESDYIVIAKITGVHGVRGNLRCHSYAESLEVFQVVPALYLKHDDGSMQALNTRSMKIHNRQLLLALKTVDTRDKARQLVGQHLYLAKKDLPALEEGTYYWFDLVGLRVTDHTGTTLGVIKQVMPTAGHDVYVVEGEAGEVLIPAIGSVVQEVNLQTGNMRVVLPEYPA